MGLPGTIGFSPPLPASEHCSSVLGAGMRHNAQAASTAAKCKWRTTVAAPGDYLTVKACPTLAYSGVANCHRGIDLVGH